MAKVRCKSCGAEYSTILRDGGHYFHACGPIPNPKYNTDPTAGPVDFATHIERPNRRDENVHPRAFFKNGKWVTVANDPHDSTHLIETPHDSRPIVAEGDGVTVLEE